MESTSEANKRIAKNTLILYIRMGVMTIIGFFTARITLSALGVEDYGIYNVVGGLTSMFSLLSNTLAASISRFLTFGLGKGDMEALKRTYSISLTLQIFISLLVILAGETIGIWFLNNKLVIPPDRLFAANIVFQFSLITFGLGLLSVPFNALIVAHEKMSAFAYMTFFDAFCKLGIVFSLLYAPGDKLILYSGLFCLQAIVSQIIYIVYCKRKFEECKYKFERDRFHYKDIFSFAGWNFIGSTAGLLSGDGVNIILNMFFGPIVNTGRGIGNQITGILQRFSNNFMTALNPQITKNCASGDLARTHSLIFKGTKFSFFLFLVLSIPILLETPQVLMIWLGQIPEYSVTFSRLAIIATLSQLLSNTLVTAQLATGKIKVYQIVVGLTNLLILPVSYVTLKFGASPYSTMVIAIIFSQICMFLRLWFLKDSMAFPMMAFIKDVYLKVVVVSLISIIPPLAVYHSLDSGIMRFIIVTLTAVLSSAFFAYTLGFSSGEREMVKLFFKKFTAKFARA